MADWEQPTTSSFDTQAAGSAEEQIATLRQQYAAALTRIESLENRVTELESGKTKHAGA